MLAVALAAALSFPGGASAAGGFSHFEDVRTYSAGMFTDVPDTAWYAGYVQSAYELGLIDGKSGDLFDPNAPLTSAEAVKLAVCLAGIYSGDPAPSAAGDPWYKPYADYAAGAGIIDPSFPVSSAKISRADFAVLLSKALPAEALTPINQIGDGAIPDVSADYSYASAVYELYRAGVLTGGAPGGDFYPSRSVSRSEAAAILARMADPDSRVSFTLSASMTAEQLYDRCSPAVFYIELYDAEGKEVKTGSGFFISTDGLAVTNFHVIQGAASAKVTTSDGKTHNVRGVYAYDRTSDVALIQVAGSGFSCLPLGDSDALAAGMTVYTIGSPLGMQNSMSKGIIAYPSRSIGGVSYIQTDAPISSGSSGGALIDTYGRVVGITAAAFTSPQTQNLNLAMPIGDILSLSAGPLVTLSSLLPNVAYYSGYYPAPDFGAYFGVEPVSRGSQEGVLKCDYLLADLPGDESALLAKYCGLLEDNNFELYASDPSQVMIIYTNALYGVEVYITNTTVNGRPGGAPVLEIVVMR